MRSWLEWGGVIVGALLVAFLIRAVVFQAFYIPSESMESTLEVKDRLLVNKLSYKLHDVNRGDVIVFEKPPGETSKINDLIKRVIALPGETIEQQGNDLYIDRGEGPQKLTERYIKDLGDIGQTLTWVQGCANPSDRDHQVHHPRGPRVGHGRQPRPQPRQPGVRADRRGPHRRPRVRQGVAAEQDRLPVATRGRGPAC